MPSAFEPIDLDRRIDELSDAEFVQFEAGQRDTVPQNYCRTCALEMIRQEFLEMLQAFPEGETPPTLEEIRGTLESWHCCATAALVQSRAAEQRGELLRCDLCRKPDGQPSWQPPPERPPDDLPHARGRPVRPEDFGDPNG
jgi:hypothetical protein